MSAKRHTKDREDTRSNTDAEAPFEEFIDPGFRSRGLYGEVTWPDREPQPWPSAPRAREGDALAASESGRGRYVGCGPRSYRRSDARIAEDINEALTWHPDIDASEVEVAVERGNVTLTGLVYDPQTRRLIVELALQTAGVAELDDRMSIGGGKASSA
ncbi:BON domain-containing protein [Nannocystis sp. ILAH1]|uniref:BON domain-containing protein n=1 Tax=unclassified Nannocystis TaxID=2627009 RepID=UPI00227150C5|nr:MULTISPECIES: BON domain-containing protein [unclassified Nannocystis]MCY0989424.1 BON domain-containing protein [Nannocystis sp. ILAH1]MCY1064881.1 BON domain-containing protein [Nannocystis sp. RBIL2]